MPVFLHVGIVHLLFNILFILVSVFEYTIRQLHIEKKHCFSAYGT